MCRARSVSQQWANGCTIGVVSISVVELKQKIHRRSCSVNNVWRNYNGLKPTVDQYNKWAAESNKKRYCRKLPKEPIGKSRVKTENLQVFWIKVSRCHFIHICARTLQVTKRPFTLQTSSKPVIYFFKRLLGNVSLYSFGSCFRRDQKHGV